MQKLANYLVHHQSKQYLSPISSISKSMFSTTMDNSGVVERVDGILADHRSALSRTVTLIESARHEHR